MLHHIKELFQKKLDSKAGKTGESEDVFCGNKTGVKRAFHKAVFRGHETRKNMADPRGYRKAETATSLGRSMVEMLGVLVIIGVLSIGALAGYNYAMDKYRANATMNDINLRGVDLIIQASRNIPLNLDDWSTISTAGYTFGTPEWTTEGTIALDISGLPERVCEMVVDGLSSQFDMDINGARIDTEATCGEENKITVYFDSEGEGIICTPACAVGEVCEKGVCIDEESQPVSGNWFLCETDADCPECKYCSEKSCKSLPNDTECRIGKCFYGECRGDVCTDNSDCKTGAFCAADEYQDQELCIVSSSICKKLDFVSKKIDVSGTIQNLYISRYEMSWYDAQQACRALGKRMVDINEMVEGFDNPAHNSRSAYYSFTEKGEKLSEKINEVYTTFWVLNSPSSCSHYSFQVYGYVYIQPASSNGAHALCQ